MGKPIFLIIILMLSISIISIVSAAESSAVSTGAPGTITGTWQLSDPSLGYYVLNQAGTRISGYFHSGQNNTNYPLEGTISGKSITFTKHMAYYDGILTGTVNGNTITGTGRSVKTRQSPNTPPTDYQFVLYRK